MKRSKILLLPLIIFSMVNVPTYAQGFIEDSNFDLMNRNFYFYRDFREGASNSSGANSQLPVADREGYRSEWAHGLIGQFKSGFTDTPIQVGIDAYGMVGLKLYSDTKKTGTNLIEFDANTGKTEDIYGEIGGALKLKYNDTTLVYGDQFPNVPVMAVSTVRLLPSTATGLSIQNKSVDNLTLNAAHFYRMNPVDSTEHINHFTTDYAAGIQADSISYLGGSYKNNDTIYTLYASELEDVWNQYFLGVNSFHKFPKEGHSISFSTANYYNKDSGNKNYGDIDVLALSGMMGYQINNHKFSLGYQQIIGDEPFDWVGFKTMGANTSILNAAQFATFSEANEKSIQFKYDLNLAPYGIEGLSLMTRYLYGWDIDNSDSKNSTYTKRYIYDKNKDYSHWERDITLAYKVPTGLAKGLDIKLRQATHRASTGYRYNNIDELRVILEYPLNF